MEEAARVVEPRRPGRTEERQELVDHAGRREEEEEEDRDRDRARDRREVERGPEEPDSLQAPVDEDGQEERDRSLDRNDEDDVVEVVAQRRAEVVLIEPGRRQQMAVVLEADVVCVRAERAAVAVPVGDAHPGRHGDRQQEEHAEDDDHRREEQPAGRRLMTADPGLPPPPPTACRERVATSRLPSSSVGCRASPAGGISPPAGFTGSSVGTLLTSGSTAARR